MTIEGIVMQMQISINILLSIFDIITCKFCRVVEIFEAYLDVLKSNGVKPYIVFDGLPLPAKKDEHANRSRYTYLYIYLFCGCISFVTES